MKILVTGGLGFIGSNFIRLLFKKYSDVKIINLDKVTYCGNFDNLRDIEKNKNYNFVKGDICDKKVVSEVMKDVEVVFNFAAETHVDRSIIEAGEFVKTDVFGTYVLMEESRKKDIKKFVQISTDEVYGSIEKGSFKETDALNPRNPYSASKAGGDRLAYSFSETYGLPVVITRSSNNFGPYQYPEKIIPLFITNLLRNKKVPLYGDGMNIRDWIFVEDNCEAIDFVAEKGKKGEVYNIGGCNEKTNIEITKLLLKFLNKKEDMIDYVKDRLGHDRRYSLDINKINQLGWKPRFEFEKSLSETVNWYKNNEWLWRKLVKH